MDTTAAKQNTVATATYFGTMSTIQLAVIVIIAIIVLAAIVTGMRLKRRRVAAERALAARREAAGAPTTPVIHTNTPTAPSPPPLADEPVVAAAPLEANPAAMAADIETAPAEPIAVAEPEPVVTEPAEENLLLIKGLGPKLVTRLNELGITRIDQIAALTAEEAAALDSQLGVFTGRMKRDRWIEQAGYLATGDRAKFEAEFGKL
jgi:predicted flap endonuclease-1-like 5' DNA nuclease